MVTTFLTISLRKLWTDRSFSFLNIIGLSLATVACTIILLYVRYERSFDDFQSSDIYRISSHSFQNNVESGSSAQVVPALAPAMKSDIPEVRYAVRFAHSNPFMADPVMQYKDKAFRESRIYFADKEFFSMFSYKMLKGSPDRVLALPDQVVLSESTARKYFGTTDPTGQTITFHRGERGAKELLITGVFGDLPANSHFHTDFVVSFATIGAELNNDWDWGNFYTYIQVHPGVQQQVVQSKIPDLLNRHIGKFVAEAAAAGYRVEFRLQPIRSIHLESKLWAELEANGDGRTVSFLTVIAIFILLIAWINYLNFSIARSNENSKEISIRKINGSSRTQLIMQLLTDSALVNLCAVIISVALIQAALPLLKVLIQIPDAISFGWIDSLIVVAILVAGTLCSGIYPAIFISRFNPVELLKSKIKRSAMSLHINKALIVFQFTASIVLIIGTIVVFRQLQFMREKELGMSLEQTLIVKGPSVKDSTYLSTLSSFRNETSKLKGIASFAVSSSIPGEELHWGRPFHRQEDPANGVGCYIIASDEKFAELFDLIFLAGENFRDDSPAAKDHIIINESAAKAFGYSEMSDAIGKTIMWQEDERSFPKQVVGVVKDFNQQSVRRKVDPIVLTLKKYVFAPWAGEFYSFKLKSAAASESIDEIHQLWKRIYPQNPFDYFFVDDYYNAQYKNDERIARVVTAFSGLAIFIASLGLFGLTAYMTVLRTKEIGVRKVLGSSTFQLVRLLSADYLLLVSIAFVIGCPVAMYIMDEWLSQFVDRIRLSLPIFISAGAICYLTALLTVGLKSWHSAMMNPVDALKYE